MLIALGVNGKGRRCVLAVELVNRESRSGWRKFLLGLKARGLRGGVLVVSDDNKRLNQAMVRLLPEAVWQRC